MTFSEATSGTGCNPTDASAIATIVSNEQCNIEMSVLRDAPFNLAQGDPIVVKAQALNVIGWSADSSIDSGAAVQTEPLKPSSAPTRAASSSQTALVTEWAALTGTDTGGSPIVSYALQYDDASGGSVWTDVIGSSSDSLALTYSVTVSITIGETYLFRYKAKNIHGWSEWSDELELVAASVPT